ncbi:hypothetical protein AB0P04_43625, partial [Streptomyces anulatus]
MAGTSSTGATKRAAALYGLGAVLVVTLTAPAASAATPHPGGGGKETAADGERDTAGGGKEAAGGRRDRAGGGKEAAGAGKEVVAGAVPRLSISIDNGKTATREGDRLTYTVVVHNTGTTDAGELHLTQSLPEGLRLVSADGHGSAKEGQVVWTVDLPAGKDATLHTTAQVGATPADLLRLATVACASTEAEGRPIVCATHSDQLPAGAAAAEAARQAASPPTGG